MQTVKLENYIEPELLEKFEFYNYNPSPKPFPKNGPTS